MPLEPLVTMFDADSASTGILLPELRALYDGNLILTPHAQRPLVYGNFVTTLDGVISYGIHGNDTGNAISGNNIADHAVMGILRACADAVIWGSGSYSAAQRFLSTPATIYAAEADLFARQRAAMHTSSEPLAVLVTASGAIPMDGAILRDARQPTVVITTESTFARLQQLESTACATWVKCVPGSKLEPLAVIRLLTEEFGVQRVLFEGGPTLFGTFLHAGVMDELFVTTAPQLAGRDGNDHHLGLVEGRSFLPQTAPWLELRSMKRSGSFLFAHYSVVGPR